MQLGCSHSMPTIRIRTLPPFPAGREIHLDIPNQDECPTQVTCKEKHNVFCSKNHYGDGKPFLESISPEQGEIGAKIFHLFQKKGLIATTGPSFSTKVATAHSFTEVKQPPIKRPLINQNINSRTHPDAKRVISSQVLRWTTEQGANEQAATPFQPCHKTPSAKPDSTRPLLIYTLI